MRPGFRVRPTGRDAYMRPYETPRAFLRGGAAFLFRVNRTLPLNQNAPIVFKNAAIMIGNLKLRPVRALSIL